MVAATDTAIASSGNNVSSNSIIEFEGTGTPTGGESTAALTASTTSSSSSSSSIQANGGGACTASVSVGGITLPLVVQPEYSLLLQFHDIEGQAQQQKGSSSKHLALEYSAMASAYLSEENFEEALICYQKSLDLYRKQFSRVGCKSNDMNSTSVSGSVGAPTCNIVDSCNAAATLHNMGAVHKICQRYDDAISCLQEAEFLYRDCSRQLPAAAASFAAQQKQQQQQQQQPLTHTIYKGTSPLCPDTVYSNTDCATTTVSIDTVLKNYNQDELEYKEMICLQLLIIETLQNRAAIHLKHQKDTSAAVECHEEVLNLLLEEKHQPVSKQKMMASSVAEKGNNNNSVIIVNNDHNEVMNCQQNRPIMAAIIDDVYFYQMDKHQRTDLILLSLKALGSLYYTNGNFKESVKALEKAIKLLKIRQKNSQNTYGINPATSKQISQLLRNLSEIYFHQNDLKRAVDALHDAMDMQLSITGEEPNKSIISAMDRMGLANETEGDFDKALACYEKVLLVRSRYLGENHLDVAESLVKIGRVLELQGNPDGGLDLYNAAHTIYQAAMTQEEGNSFGAAATESVVRISAVLIEQKRYEEAVAFLTQSLHGSTTKATSNEFGGNNDCTIIPDDKKYEESKNVDPSKYSHGMADEAFVFRELGRAYLGLKKFVSAKKCLLESARRFEGTDNEEAVFALLQRVEFIQRAESNNHNISRAGISGRGFHSSRRGIDDLAVIQHNQGNLDPIIEEVDNQMLRKYHGNEKLLTKKKSKIKKREQHQQFPHTNESDSDSVSNREANEHPPATRKNQVVLGDIGDRDRKLTRDTVGEMNQIAEPICRRTTSDTVEAFVGDRITSDQNLDVADDKPSIPFRLPLLPPPPHLPPSSSPSHGNRCQVSSVENGAFHHRNRQIKLLSSPSRVVSPDNVRSVGFIDGEDEDDDAYDSDLSGEASVGHDIGGYKSESCGRRYLVRRGRSDISSSCSGIESDTESGEYHEDLDYDDSMSNSSSCSITGDGKEVERNDSNLRCGVTSGSNGRKAIDGNWKQTQYAFPKNAVAVSELVTSSRSEESGSVFNDVVTSIDQDDEDVVECEEHIMREDILQRDVDQVELQASPLGSSGGRLRIDITNFNDTPTQPLHSRNIFEPSQKRSKNPNICSNTKGISSSPATTSRPELSDYMVAERKAPISSFSNKPLSVMPAIPSPNRGKVDGEAAKSSPRNRLVNALSVPFRRARRRGFNPLTPEQEANETAKSQTEDDLDSFMGEDEGGGPIPFVAMKSRSWDDAVSQITFAIEDSISKGAGSEQQNNQWWWSGVTTGGFVQDWFSSSYVNQAVEAAEGFLSAKSIHAQGKSRQLDFGYNDEEASFSNPLDAAIGAMAGGVSNFECTSPTNESTCKAAETQSTISLTKPPAPDSSLVHKNIKSSKSCFPTDMSKDIDDNIEPAYAQSTDIGKKPKLDAQSSPIDILPTEDGSNNDGAMVISTLPCLRRQDSESSSNFGVGISPMHRLHETSKKNLLKEVSSLENLLIKQKEEVGINHPSVATSLFQLSMLHVQNKNYLAAYNLASEAMQIQKALGNRTETARALHVLADIYTRQNQFKAALTCYGDIQRLEVQIFGYYHHETANTLNRIGSIHALREEFGLAMGRHQEALRILKECYGEDLRHPMVSQTLIHIGAVYYCERNSLSTIKTNVDGYSTFIEAGMLEVIGRAHEERGSYKMAIAFFEEKLQLLRNKKNRESSLELEEVSATLNSLGMLSCRAGMLLEAIDYYNEALAIQQQLGCDKAYIATALVLAATVQFHLGHSCKALKMLEDALSALQAEVGKDHETVAATWFQIGIVKVSLCCYDDAMDALEEALRIQDKLLGRNHPATLRTRREMGNMHAIYESEVDAALEQFSEILDSQKKIHGEKHPNVAETLHSIGCAFARKGELKRALKTLEECYYMRVEFIGTDHPLQATTLAEMVQVLLKRGNFKKALNISNVVLNIRKECLSELHIDIARALAAKGSCLLAKGDINDASKCLTEASSLAQQSVGLKHPYVADINVQLAAMYLRKCEFEKSKAMVNEALEKYSSALFDNDHPSIQNALSLMSRVVRDEMLCV